MKFAEHLAAHITPEWRKQYISYEEMKVCTFCKATTCKISYNYIYYYPGIGLLEFYSYLPNLFLHADYWNAIYFFWQSPLLFTL